LLEKLPYKKKDKMTEIQRIEFLDFSVFMATRNGLTALATKHFLDWQFYGLKEDERRKVFKTNVANNILYAANDALIDISIVSVTEHIKSEAGRGSLPFLVPDLGVLMDHRDVISHPGTVEFSNAKVQKFFEEQGRYKDPKAVRLWRTRQALLDWLILQGKTPKYPNAVDVHQGTVEMIHSVMTISYKDGVVPPSSADTLETVSKYFKKYEETIINKISTESTAVRLGGATEVGRAEAVADAA
jgi:hypothetical protein